MHCFIIFYITSLGLIKERNERGQDNETNDHALEVLNETEYAHKVIIMGIEQTISKKRCPTNGESRTTDQLNQTH